MFDADWLEATIAYDHQRVLAHPLYSSLPDVAALRVFTEHHVYAVWDFMALLVTLRERLRSGTRWWLPPNNGEAMHCVNEIMVAEETDDPPNGDGVHLSHFALYVAAMEQLGANLGPVRAFCAEIRANANPGEAMQRAHAPDAATRFVRHTTTVARFGSLAEAAASFAYGRERVIPPMFERVLVDDSLATSLLRTYFLRHVELDGGLHGDLARQLVTAVCRSDDRKWQDAALAARNALVERYALWDAILKALP